MRQGKFLWMFHVRIARLQKRDVRIMAENQREAHRELKRQFPSCNIIREWRPTMTLHPTPESVN